MEPLTIDTIAKFCKKKGFVYPNSEIYGGMAGFFDYGPLGVELKKNIKDAWWRFHVHQRSDVVGIDGSIITHPKVWVASGHVANFEDLLLECTKCGEKYRADVFIEEKTGKAADGIKPDEINRIVQEKALVCDKCKGRFKPVEKFNLMFRTNVGPKTDTESATYLRPETAQLIFADFKQVTDTNRLKLPFGIAQIGKAFRNEISPRNFLFRCREFEQMELEYFINPADTNNCPFLSEVADHQINVFSAQMQQDGKLEGTTMTITAALKEGIIKTPWHGYWLATEHRWFISLGATADNFRIRQHVQTEKSHYALDTWDLQYKFPFGWQELQGMANRTDFDLQQHIKHSKVDLSLFIEEEKKRVVPHVVAEPSQGVDRAFLVFITDAYNYNSEKDTVVLKLHPSLAPFKVAVFPLVSKDGLPEKAQEIYRDLKREINAFYDQSGSVGRRYARQDEIGTPYCVTVDYDTLKDGTVTIRNRDDAVQKRIGVEKLPVTLQALIKGALTFDAL